MKNNKTYPIRWTTFYVPFTFNEPTMKKNKPQPKPSPKTKAQLAAERCQLSCRIGIAAIEHVALEKDGYNTQYALYCLLRAVEDLSQQIAHEAKACKQNHDTY